MVLGAACGEDTLVRLQADIRVVPERLDFGEAAVGVETASTLTIINRGGGPLLLEAPSIAPEDGVFRTGAFPEEIREHSESEVTVLFAPPAPRTDYTGTLVIRSNDADTPVLEVPLSGRGGVREIEVFPAEIDFGVTNEGTAPRRAVEIRNVGGDRLTVSEVTFTSTSIDLAIARGAFARGTILPGTSTVVEVVYDPVDLGGDQGVLLIRSDDEDEPAIEIPVRGKANLAPRAIAWGCEKLPGQIGCEGRETARTLTAGFRRLIGLDGRESRDPEGGAIASYRWETLARPAQSNATVFHSSEDLARMRSTGDIEIDRVGRYDLRLVAKDARGLESLDRPESHVFVLPKELEVLLRWDITTDVDLHLVRPGGTVGDYGSGVAGTSTGADCSSFNRGPNWGDASTARDDPRLDKDDVTGRGPEIVSLDGAEVEGTYEAFAHYCDSRDVRVPANVTLEVWVRGTLVHTAPASGGVTLASGELWHAARIRWDRATEAAAVEDLGAGAITSRPELCLSP